MSNLVSTIIMCLALTLGSGGRFQSISMGLSGFACLLPAAYWLHRIVFEGDYPFVRQAAIFSLLTITGFVNVITLLIRYDQEGGMALMRDFARLEHPARIAKASIALAFFSTFFSIIGFIAAQISYMSQRRECSVESADVPMQGIATWQIGDQLFQTPFTNSTSTTLAPRIVPDLKVKRR